MAETTIDSASADARSLAADGHVVLRGLLDEATVAAYRAALERCFADDPGVAANRRRFGDRVLYLENLPAKDRVFEDYLMHDRLLGLLAAELGADFAASELWGHSVLPGGFTEPGAPLPARYHTDKPLCLPDHTLVVEVCFALTPFTRANGATRVVPGTHRSGRQPDPGLTDHPDEACLEAEAGDCVVFTGELWHRAGGNFSDVPRVGLWAQFQRGWAKPLMDFTRALPPELLSRATPELRRIYGFGRRVPFTERWAWDEATGRPRADAPPAATDPFCPRCLGDHG